jgi:hypothetical protein
MSTHPKGTRARILLSSVFGPYAQDDEFGSRAINPMDFITIRSPGLRGVLASGCSTARGAS